MSVVPTSAAAVLASAAAASERASKVQTNSKEADQARRAKHGKPTGDRIVLSANAVEKATSATDRPEGNPESAATEQESGQTPHLDVQG